MGEGTEGVTTSFKAVMQHTITASASSGGTEAATSKRRQMLTTYGHSNLATCGSAPLVQLHTCLYQEEGQSSITHTGGIQTAAHQSENDKCTLVVWMGFHFEAL